MPRAFFELCARPRSDANIHAWDDIRCSRSVVLQPPGRTPAMVAQGFRAVVFGGGDALRPITCPTRCRSAPFVVLRAAPWRIFVLRVAAFSQTWLARVAARAAPARRCRVEQRFVFLVLCYLIIGLAVSGVSVLCFTWATVLRQCCREGASCGWRRSRKGVPTGSARIPRGTLRDVRAPAVWRNFRAHTCV